MAGKFSIGTDVRFTNHEMKVLTGKTKRPIHRHLKSGVVYTPNPEDLKLIKRNAFHQVKSIRYSPERKRNLYKLKAHGRLGEVEFDSTQLTTRPLPKPGRPRTKRPYHHKRQYRRIKHRNRS